MPVSARIARIVPSRRPATAPAGRRRQSFLSARRKPAAPALPTATKSLTTLPQESQRLRQLPEVWFNATFPVSEGGSQLDPRRNRQEGDRKVKLGKTLRVLQEHLPTLLQSPLPQEVLAPQITLHLFPSTHPHLPAVSGRVAYMAALWTSPIAWNRFPVVGNVRLEILSERMVSPPAVLSAPRRAGALGEQLVVRWRTAQKGRGERAGGGGGGGERKAPVGDAQGVGDRDRQFTGLFIFEFDAEGRILSHTIEHVDQGGQWERGVGAKFVGLTDWLLGGIKGGRGGSESTCPAFARKGR